MPPNKDNSARHLGCNVLGHALTISDVLIFFCWYDVDDDVVVDNGADADDDADDPFDKASRGDEHESGSSQLWFNSCNIFFFADHHEISTYLSVTFPETIPLLPCFCGRHDEFFVSIIIWWLSNNHHPTKRM